MTQIPAPPVLPKPKSISKHNDAATMEHDALLRIVWRNLDGLIKLLYADATAKCADSVEDSITSYLATVQRAAERARQLAQGSPDHPARADVQELVSRLVSKDKSSVPAVSAEMLEPIIERRILAAPVKEHKTVANRTKVTQVGFVDIACDVNIPTRLKLVDNLPYFLQSRRPFSFQEDEAVNISTKEIQEAPRSPHWTVEHEALSFWMDIRVTPLPLGQFLRELKTLRSYSAGGSVICVIMPSLDRDTSTLLSEERFIPISSQWLAQQGFV